MAPILISGQSPPPWVSIIDEHNQGEWRYLVVYDYVWSCHCIETDCEKKTFELHCVEYRGRVWGCKAVSHSYHKVTFSLGSWKFFTIAQVWFKDLKNPYTVNAVYTEAGDILCLKFGHNS